MMSVDFNRVNRQTGKNEDYCNDYFKEGMSNVRGHMLFNLLSEYGGMMYDGGLFNIHNFGSSFFWQKVVEEYFPKYKSKFYCFGFDWMGRHYGVNKHNTTIFMFDHSEGQVYELEQNLKAFFNIDLVEYKADTLASSTFKQLEKLHKNNLAYSKCIGFKKLLFLGGADTLDNYEIQDMEVSWDLNYQVYAQIKGLPQGSVVKRINIG